MWNVQNLNVQIEKISQTQYTPYKIGKTHIVHRKVVGKLNETKCVQDFESHCVLASWSNLAYKYIL